MKRVSTRLILFCVILLLFLTGCGRQGSVNSGAVPENGRIITDMAGRKVTLPPKIEKVYPVSPVEMVLMYTLAPELLAGWSYHMAADQSDYILPEYKQLPVLAWTTRGSVSNVEEIIKMNPSLILMVTEMNAANKEYADKLEQLAKIPVVMLDNNINKMAELYLTAGKVLGREERAGKLAAYCRETMELVAAKKPLLQERNPVTVYYAEGRRGLETEPRGSWHAEIIEFVGGLNVAEPGLPASGAIGRSPVSMEQVLAWNPEIILISYFRDGEDSSYPMILEEKPWQNVRGVKARQVYEIPTGPFNWFDRPPAVSRLIGIRWVANLLYPDVYPFDFRSEVKRFYSLFYHYQLSEQELDELAARAQRVQ